MIALAILAAWGWAALLILVRANVVLKGRAHDASEAVAVIVGAPAIAFILAWDSLVRRFRRC